MFEFNAFPINEAQIDLCYPPFCGASPPILSTPVSIEQPLRWRHTAQPDPGIASNQGQRSQNSKNDHGLQLNEQPVDDDDGTLYSYYDQMVLYQDGPSPTETSQWVIDSTFIRRLVQVIPDPVEEIAFTYCSYKRKSIKPYRRVCIEQD